MNVIVICFFVCLQLLPLVAQAQPTLRTPLSYSLQEYGIVLGMALLGGIASWWMKVKRGELLAWNLSSLIGELCVSAFAGLLAFLLCEYFALHPMLTPAIVGMSGHAGAKGIGWLESLGQHVIERKLGIDRANASPSGESEK